MKIRRVENVHILLWLIKDLSWVMIWKPLGLAMIAPTVGVAVWLLARSWSDFEERMHNLAVCYWIAANSIWMTGEFFEVESARTLAAIAFGLGLCSIGRFYIAKILLWWRQREL